MIKLSEFKFSIDIKSMTPFLILIVALLLISKIPTFSLKKIKVSSKLSIFLLFGIVLFFGLLLVYTFNVIAISAIVYLLLLPISYVHYQKIKNKHEKDKIQDEDDLEDVL